MLEGDDAVSVAEGGDLSNLSGVDVADDGTVYVVSATGASEAPEEKLFGGGRGALFELRGGQVRLLAAGFEAPEPSGVVVLGATVALSSYQGRGDSSAVLLYDVASGQLEPTVYVNDYLREINVSGGLHKNPTTRQLAWSGGNTVFAIKP
jgi:hypothetical protein